MHERRNGPTSARPSLALIRACLQFMRIAIREDIGTRRFVWKHLQNNVSKPGKFDSTQVVLLLIV